MEVWNVIWKKILVWNGIWNGRFLVWNGNGMEKNCRYGIWKNRLPFHSIPCPGYHSFNFFFIAQYCSFNRLVFFLLPYFIQTPFLLDDLLHFFIPPLCCFLIMTTFRYSTNSFGYIHILATIILTFRFFFCIFHHFDFFVFRYPQFHFSGIFQLSNSSMLHHQLHDEQSVL